MSPKLPNIILRYCTHLYVYTNDFVCVILACLYGGVIYIISELTAKDNFNIGIYCKPLNILFSKTAQ